MKARFCLKMRKAKCSLGMSAGMRGGGSRETGNPVTGGLRNLVPFEERTVVDNNQEGKVEAMNLVVSFISS